MDITKMTGAGNDFIMYHDPTNSFQHKEKEISLMCNRNFGIGSDGMIIVTPSNLQNVHFKMTYYNSDGRMGTLCGNGARCAMLFAKKLGLGETIFTFENNHKIFQGEVLSNNMVKLICSQPIDFRSPLIADGYEGHFVNSGSPHFVTFVEDTDLVDIERDGKKIRCNNELFKHGTNVNFVHLLSPNSVSVRTFERGVETETLACGTACVAVAYIGRKLDMLTSNKIFLTVRSGLTLQVEMDNSHHNIALIGHADTSFTATINKDYINKYIEYAIRK